MSADEGSVAAPAAEGPVEITLVGHEAPAALAAPVVETPAEEPKEAPKAAGSEEPTGETRDEKGRFKSGGVQDRIDELTRARREAEREAEYWRVRATGEAPGKQAAPAQEQPKQNAAPVRENFQSDAEYIDALADHKVEQKLSQREAAQQQAAEQQSKAQGWQSKLAEARAEIADFDTVMNNSDAQVAGHVAELVMEHDQGAKVAHFLAANPDALEKINGMTPAKAAFEIGKIAAKFEATAAKAAGSSEPAPEVRASKAPPPASRQVGSGTATAPKLEELSMDEYVARRKAQGASWAR